MVSLTLCLKTQTLTNYVIYVLSSYAGEQTNTYDGRVIIVKLGEYTKRIGIDGSADAIKEAIKSAFRLRTKRAFWLEDEDNVVRSLDRDMPLGNYTLHVDEGREKETFA